MTTAAIALAASLAALLVAGLLAAGAHRARREAEGRLGLALARMGERVDALSHELAGAIERVQEDARRARTIDALGRSLDLDEVLAQTVDAACALSGASAAVVQFADPDGPPIVAARGVLPAEAAEHVVAGPPDGSPVRAVALSYHYRPEAEPAPALRSAIAVPLEVDGALRGFLAVYSGAEDAAVEADAFEALEAIAEHAGPAIENARRFREAGRQAADDPVTSLPSRRGFHEALGREVARAHRSERPLSILLVDIDGLRDLTRAHGQAVGEEAIGELEQALRDASRETDVICRVGADAFAVILIDAGRIEGEAQFARVQATLRRGVPREDYLLTVSGGIGELRPDDDAVSLLERADAALRRAKDAGRGTAA